MLTDLTKLTIGDVVDLLEQSGYGGDDITEAKFQWAADGKVKYTIKFINMEDEEQTGAIFIFIDGAGHLVAEF